VDPRAGLDGVEKRKFLPLPGLELWPLDRSQSLYRLRYPGSSFLLRNFIMSIVLAPQGGYEVDSTDYYHVQFWTLHLTMLNFLVLLRHNDLKINGELESVFEMHLYCQM
jgi:hypothetical protein